MRKEIRIPKNRLYAGTDYTSVFLRGVWNGYTLSKTECEEVEFPTGRVCFFDPYNAGSAKPFRERIPAGKYKPFMMLVSTDKGKRVALLGLDSGMFALAKQWISVFSDTGELIKLRLSEQGVGTVIGSGFGAICDEKTYEDFCALVHASADAFHPLDGIVRMDGSYAGLVRVKGVSLPVCNTGWGEGVYRTYAGLDAAGNCVGLVCDFGLIPSRPRKDDGVVSFTLDVRPEDLYVPDPKLSDAENAVAKYTTVIAEDPDAVSVFHAYARRGYAYHVAGRYDEALRDYLQAIRMGKDKQNGIDFVSFAWSLYDNAALIYREAGRTEEAVALYTEAKQLSETFDGGAYAGLIDLYEESKDYEKALAVCDEMVAARPHDPAAYAERSELYMACGEYEKAIADIDVLIGTFKLSESVFDKATCLSQLGRHEAALTVLDAYLTDGHANEAYYDIRAGVELAAGNFAAAYIDARNAHDVNPDYFPALQKLIDMDERLFDYKNVVKWATCAVEAHPHARYGYLVRAEALCKLHEYADAVSDYLHLAHTGKDDARVYGLTVRAALLAGEKGIAKKYARRLRGMDDAYCLYAMGLLLLHARKFARAERYLASAFSLREEETILAALLECLIVRKRYAKAVFYLPAYVRLADGPDAFAMRARLCKARGESTDDVRKEYIARYLGDLGDEGFLGKVDAFFRRIEAEGKT